MLDYITVCEKAARAGGAILLEKLGRVNVRYKGPADLVTEADLASQKAIRDVLLDAFPDHYVLGEEDGPGDRPPCQPGQHRWMVDPLDGTTNYVHQVPHFSVSVAVERDGQLLAGTVFSPVEGECYTAVAGEGAYLNGRRIHTSGVTKLADSLAAVGFPAEVDQNSPDLQVFLKAVGRCQAIRRTGSAALNLCYVAAGRFDLAWCFSTKVWDVAAGVLLIREAGGLVEPAYADRPILTSGKAVTAANETLFAQLRELLAEAGV